MPNLLLRILTSLILLPIVLVALFLGGYYFITLLLMVSLRATYEAAVIIDRQRHYPVFLPVIFSLIIFLPTVLSNDANFTVFLFLPILAFNVILLFYNKLVEQFKTLSSIFYWSIYINFSLTSIYWLTANPNFVTPRAGISLVLLACLSTFSNDTFAYLIGRVMGKRPLFKTVSAKKTWEGLICGMVMSLVSVAIGYYVPKALGYNWLMGVTTKDLLWVSLPAMILAPFGDLVESRLKRLYDVKDSSHLLPGHGGLLDRIDGLLMVMPWTALYAFIIRPLW